MTGNVALVVDRAGAILERGTHDTVVLTSPDGHRERMGLKALGSVVLHGDVKLSTSLLQALTAQGLVPMLLPLGGMPTSVSFCHSPCRHVLLRHRQHLAYASSTLRLKLARHVLLSKLEAMTAFSRSHGLENTDALYQSMHAAVSEVDISGLLGVEGAATLRHFEELAGLYERAGHFRFNGRSRRPPLDEPNALMSLAYTLAETQALQLAMRAGLDVQVGFLHALYRDRPSIAMDLIEPARAGIDDWVFGLLTQRKLLPPKMFSHGAAGQVMLNKEGRSLFYPAWFREGYRTALQPMRSLLAKLLACLGRMKEGMV